MATFRINRTIAINILGFNLFDEKKYPDMHSCFGIYDNQDSVPADGQAGDTFP